MKKQLLIAAVAASMTSVAMADISIAGNAKYEYKNIEDTANATSNTGNTEVNLVVTGKTGDTSVVVATEFTDGSSTSAGAGVNVEDMYMTTKIGDVTIKAGDYASGTAGFLGEIDNGARGTDKVTLSGDLAGVAVSYSSTPGTGSSDAVVLSTDIAGYTVSLKESSNAYSAIGISGDVAGFGVRLDHLNSDTANADITFGSITKDVSGVTLGYAWIDADDASTLATEDDSSIFAVEMAASGVQRTNTNGVQQVSAVMDAAGNTVTVKAGSLKAEAGYQDADFTQIDIKRPLASGATLALTYTDADTAEVANGTAMTDTVTFEADISVKF